ncbi:MAG: hypothetical protein AB8B50_00330 [Pirellulaceae bacterium]
MRDILFESPTTIVVLSGVVALIAAVLWTQVNDRLVQRIALFIMLGSVLLGTILVATSFMVKTDKERITARLNEIASALQRNDREAVYAAIHPNASEGVRRAKAELPSYTFSDARVTRIKSIQVSNETAPRTALAEFNVVVAVETGMGGARVPRFVHVYFMEDAGRWMVNDYEHFDATAGFRNTPLTNGIGLPAGGR